MSLSALGTLRVPFRVRVVVTPNTTGILTFFSTSSTPTSLLKVPVLLFVT